MPRGLQQKGILRRNKMLHEAIRLFLTNGYEKTTTSAIAKAAGMSPSSFFAAFESKEELLLSLVGVMFNNQFQSAEGLQAQKAEPALLYGIETALQVYIAELSEPLRELYVMAYSLPSTSEYIYQQTASRLEGIFGKYLPEAQFRDYYEMDIASSGIMRAYMARPCDQYFTIERKLSRFLHSCLTLYAVPQERQEVIIQTVLHMDLKSEAERIIQGMIQKASAGMEIIPE